MRVNTVVFLPGLDGTGDLFAELGSILAPTLRVVVARYPTDHFLSYPDLIASVNRMLPSDDPFILMAESFSTPLATMIAAARPRNLVGLVLCAGFVSSPFGGSKALFQRLVGPWLFRSLPPGFLLRYFLLGSDPPAALEDILRQALQLVNPHVLSARVHSVLTCDAREDLVRVRVPMMYIRAEGDRLVRERSSREIERLRPDTLFVSVRAPHLVCQREPQKVAEFLMRFIQQVSS